MEKAAGEQYEEAHLEELAFPVFEQGRPEMRGVQVGQHIYRAATILGKFLVVHVHTCPYLACNEQEHRGEQHNAQAVLLQKRSSWR